MSITQRADMLIDRIRGYGSVAVAMSAGVDSTVVAKGAVLALGTSAIALTAESPSVPAGEVHSAQELAASMGLRHEVIRTDEFENPNYLANPSNRCFYCKTSLYSAMEARARELGFRVLANGTNHDDLGDHRPGLEAATDFAVKSPLVEEGLCKQDVRDLAQFWGLAVWDKPAAPCLSSRIAYGVAVTPERLRRIDTAEMWLKAELKLRELRVRCESGELARIEVPVTALPRLVEPEMAKRTAEQMKRLGFRYVTIDLEGFRSGSLNLVILK